jgi:hypothetical protein
MTSNPASLRSIRGCIFIAMTLKQEMRTPEHCLLIRRLSHYSPNHPDLVAAQIGWNHQTPDPRGQQGKSLCEAIILWHWARCCLLP